MRMVRCCLVAAVLLVSAVAHAADVVFNDLPDAWATALATPGRQIVGGEPSITFDIANDVFVFDPTVFGVSGIIFANDLAANLPASATVVVVQDAGLNAAAAANAIAAEITVSTPGFFVYFNAGLDLPRLVYSADLSDDTADLLVLARLTNLELTDLPTFTAGNFSLEAAVPTLSEWMLVPMAALLAIARMRAV